MLIKPIKNKRVEKWGVYRKNTKPKRFKKNLDEKIIHILDEDPLLEPWSVGKKLGLVSPEIYAEVKKRSGNKCEICGKPANCVHHIVGRRRRAWSGNLIDLCKHHHDEDGSEVAIHRRGETHIKVMSNLLKLYSSMGYSEKEIKFLLVVDSLELYKENI